MGYRSQVVCRVHGSTNLIVNTIALLRLRGSPKQVEEIDKALTECQVVLDKDDPTHATFAFEFDSVKWYSDYENVRALESLWDAFDEKEGELNGAFARIGEDDHDIEARYFGDDSYYLVSVHRSIEAVSIHGPNLLSSNIELPTIETQGQT